MAIHQLIEISTGKVVYEHDDANGPLPEFGGPWGNPNLHKWQPAPKSVVLDKAKVDKIQQLTMEYNILLEQGVFYNGAKFDSDEHSQTEIARVLTALANGWTLPAGFEWIDSSNTPHSVPDVAWLQGLAQAMADHKAALFARLQKAKAAVRTATNVTAVNKVVL